MRIGRTAFGLLMCGVTATFANWPAPTQTTAKYVPKIWQQREKVANGNSAENLLQRGLYFSDLYNWAAARPYLIKAHQLFEATADKRNALYAELAVMRAGADPAPLPELSYKLKHELEANPILQSDKELRMFCLIVKGEFDGEVASDAMRRDWTEVSALARELGNAKWQYRSQGQLGFADFYDGDLPGAQKNVAEALIGATTVNDIGGQVFYLSTMAEGLVGQSMNDQALQYADRAIALANETPDAGYPIIAEKARLLAMINKGQIEMAKVELAKALAYAEAQKSYSQMADLNATAARIARLQNDLSSAIKYLSEALRDVTIVGGRKVMPELLSELSDLYRLSGNLSKAEELANEAAISGQRFGYIPLVPGFLKVLAQIQVDQHKYLEADQTYDRAAAIQDTMIEHANSDLGKTALVKGASDLYAKHFALLAEHSDNATKAFTVVEQARGRVMTDLLTSGAKTSAESLAAENKIAQLRLKLMAARSNRDVEQLRDAIFLAEQSRSITPEISILQAKEHQAITLAKLQRNLSPSEAVLEYVIDDPASYCLVITRTKHRIVKLAGKQIISPAVDAYLNQVKARHSARIEARKLYLLLLASVHEAKRKQQVVIVRDGPLYLVPFDALIDISDRYVLDFQTVVYAPSATSFFLLRTAQPARNPTPGILAVGGIPYDRSGLKQSAITRGFRESGLSNLPSSEEEARAVVDALPDKLNVLLVGKDATETAVKRSTNHRIIHLAVHAIANQARPDRASLVLLSDAVNGEDGFLEALEIVQLSLNADLVVLSACDTAVGPIEGEEGISTLSRAFLLAGARTVVSTLWSIDDDSTLYLMRSFYEALAQKKPAPYALRIAKQNMLKTFGPTKALPFYWAAFTIEGLARPPIGR